MTQLELNRIIRTALKPEFSHVVKFYSKGNYYRNWFFKKVVTQEPFINLTYKGHRYTINAKTSLSDALGMLQSLRK